ncbi:MAG: pyridoxamine 5'-phosphate oxidase family protein [Candidatus Saccharimonadales bacterium]
MNSADKARYIVNNNQLATVATADQDGKPWVSPVGCVCDDRTNIYWVSHNYSVHSQNIRSRPEVAIVIVGTQPDGTNDGVYFDAVAKELNDEEEILAAMKLLQTWDQDEKFKINSLTDVTGDAVWRVYMATPIKIYKRADKTLKGQAITIREEVRL